MTAVVLMALLTVGLVPLIQRDLRRAVQRRQQQRRFSRQLANVAPAFAAMGAALSGFGSSMVKAAADFEAAMGRMRAAIGAASPITALQTATFGGIPVVQSNLATRRPTPGEDARRIVRHGMAGVLEQLGESVGPRPGEPVPAAYMMDGKLVAHPAVVARLREGAAVFKGLAL